MTNPYLEQTIITLASQNEGKRMELVRHLEESGLPFKIMLNEGADSVAETGADFSENALLKARLTPPAVTDGYVLGEDSGMVVDTLEGAYGIRPFPGLYSNRWLTPERRDALLGKAFPNVMPLERIGETGVSNQDLCRAILTLMRDKPHRSARYCCAMALWHPARGLCFQTVETLELVIIEGEPRGSEGFGYDPIVSPVDADGHPDNRTLAEYTTVEKNRISHRGRAFQQVLAYLRTTGDRSFQTPSA